MVPTDFMWFQSCTGLAFPTIFLQWPGRLDRSDWVNLEMIVVTGRDLYTPSKKTSKCNQGMQNPMSDKGSFTLALQEIFWCKSAQNFRKKQNVYQFWDPFQSTSKFHSNNSGKHKLKAIWTYLVLLIELWIELINQLYFIQFIIQRRRRVFPDRGFHVVSTDPTCFYLCQEASPKNSRPLVGWDILLCEVLVLLTGKNKTKQQ